MSRLIRALSEHDHGWADGARHGHLGRTPHDPSRPETTHRQTIHPEDPVPPDLTYPETGATLERPLPAGYHHLHHTALIGHGREVFQRAGTAVVTWRMHRRTGVRVVADTPRAEPGTRVSVGFGTARRGITAPCAVVWTVDDTTRTGFAYGTLPGHPETGEESFVVDLRPDGSVWFTVTAFSRPGCWYTRLAGPVVPLLQRAYAVQLGRTLRRLAT